jgi:hypothetical protein
MKFPWTKKPQNNAALEAIQTDLSLNASADVGVIRHPQKYSAFSRSQMLSPGGQGKTLDAAANSYVPNEGAAAHPALPRQAPPAYYQQLVETLAIDAATQTAILQKTLLLLHQFTFKKYLEEWTPLLIQHGIELEQAVYQQLTNLTLRQRQLTLLILFSCLKKLHQQWNLAKNSILFSAGASELADLAVDEVIAKEQLIALLLSASAQPENNWQQPARHTEQQQALSLYPLAKTDNRIAAETKPQIKFKINSEINPKIKPEVNPEINSKINLEVKPEINFAKNMLSLLIRRHGIYLISGGAGRLDLTLARYLAEQYQAKVILIGRSKLDEKQQAIFAQFHQAGAEVFYLKADVDKLADTVKIVAAIKTRFGALNGVIYHAGALRDAFILKNSAQQIAEALAPKIQGVMNLDAATKDEKLDFFILLSSISSLRLASRCAYDYD